MNIKLIATTATLVVGGVLTMFAKKGVEAKVSEKNTEENSLPTTGEQVTVEVLDNDADDGNDGDETEEEKTED